MHFEVIESVTLAGRHDRPNEDRAGATAWMAWVIDGATDLVPPGLMGAQGGAVWLAETFDGALRAAPDAPLSDLCAEAFDRVEARYHSDRTRAPEAFWEVPRAAFAAVRLTDTGGEVAWAADSPVLLIGSQGPRWLTPKPDTAQERSAAQALGEGTGAAPRLTGAALADRRARRAGDPDGALSALAERSRAATRYADVAIAPGDEIVLMSDGVSALISDYGAQTAESFADAVRDGGLIPLLHHLRAIEAEDAACTRFPRFKVSDDATALWVRVAR
ncbi:MAG: hypothetical protein ACU0CI_11475 [Shimia sp.]